MLESYLEQIQRTYPDLHIEAARLHTHDGQFCDVLVVDEALIFRFPRSPHVAQEMAHEIALLRRLQGKLPLPIPNPLYSAAHPQSGDPLFMGYPLLPGEVLWRDTLDDIHDETVLNRLSGQLATFLKTLHSLPLSTVGSDTPVGETQAYWQALYDGFRETLYPYMRNDARAQVSAQFETHLSDPANFAYTPVLRHGDFGIGNILYDPQAQSISGVIDWTSAGPGDPAQDLGALLSFGDSFVERCLAVYPELRASAGRLAFIRSTYALQQAYYALRENNQADFEDGIADYV